MTTALQGEVRQQQPIDSPPFDRWLDPDGDMVAEFYRLPGHYLLRFPDRADFEIGADLVTVRCFPALEADDDAVEALFHNAIVPLLGNHTGKLHLHGSAVVIAGSAYAFMGRSRRGKTTLAGAFAARGHPYLTEDVVALERMAVGGFMVRPTRPVLRLFADSARHLLGEDVAGVEEDCKNPVDPAGRLPFAVAGAPLAGIFLLGPGEAEDVLIQPVSAHAALAEMMQHAFILDVEDKLRLRGHFQRLGELAAEVPCYSLDFPRVYEQLSHVVDEIVDRATNGRDSHETE